jgi:hypothetical protein
MILEAVATDVKDLSGRIIDDNRATGAWVNISGRGASLSMHGDPLRLQCLDNLQPRLPSEFEACACWHT